MILPRLEFRSPKTMQEALSIYQEFTGEALFLGGGTDLIPRIKLRLEKPRALIDLKRISTLKTIEEQDDCIRIGALMSIFDLKDNALVIKHFPALRASLEATSCETLQMRGTIGGNLLQNTRCLFYNQSEFWRKSKGFCLKMGGKNCNAVPGAKMCFANYCSDNATALCTLSAEIKLFGPDGERILPLLDLFSNKGGKPFNLQRGEILSDILIPKQKSVGGYDKLRLRCSIDYPLLGVAFSLMKDAGKLAVAAVGPKPMVFDIEEMSVERLQEYLDKASQQARPVANTVLDPDYRKRMIEVLAGRLIRKSIEVGL